MQLDIPVASQHTQPPAWTGWTIRPVQVGDEQAFEGLLADLSPEDLICRFGYTLSRGHAAVRRYLFGPSQPCREVLGAFGPGGTFLGSANLGAVDDSGGEVAVIVGRSARRRSIATGLLLATAAQATRAGLKHLDAMVLASNEAAARLTASLGFKVRDRSGSQIWLDWELGPSVARSAARLAGCIA